MTNEEKANLIFKLCYEYLAGWRSDKRDSVMMQEIQDIIEDKYVAIRDGKS